MTRHSGISIDDDGVTLVLAPEDPATAPAEVAFAPALLVLTPGGPPIAGRQARRLAASGVAAAFTDFCARVGDPVPVVGSDGTAREAADLVALTITCLIRDIGSPQGPDQHLTIAYPASWEPYRIGELSRALARVELDGPTTSLVPRPAAIIRTLSGRPPGPLVVVDIGHYGTEIATLAAGPGQKITGVYPADLGTAELDWVVLGHALEGLSAELAEQVDRLDLMARCRAARRELTRNAAAVIEVPVTDGIERVRITRAEFEEAVHQPVMELAAAIYRAVGDDHRNSAGDRRMMVTGDGADLPLLAQALSSYTATRPWTAPDTAAVATGAAHLSADRARAARRRSSTGVRVPPAPATQVRVPPAPATTHARLGASPDSAAPAAAAPTRIASAAAAHVRPNASPGPSAPAGGAPTRLRPGVPESIPSSFDTPVSRTQQRSRGGFRTALVAGSAAVAVLIGGAAIGMGGHDSGPGWHAGH